MKRKIITTGDGSKTIQIEDWNEQYHSIHGAIQEANHVFIKNGLIHLKTFESFINNEAPIAILEIGFGTALNAFITAIESERLNHSIDYVGVEAYPISVKEIQELNYPEIISSDHTDLFKRLHESEWEQQVQITKTFKLTKRQQFFSEITDINNYDLIYFDAFGARVQPELWTDIIFKKMYDALKLEGVLVTYSAKGSVKRAMQSVGFVVERLQGPPGKRHMLRASKKL